MEDFGVSSEHERFVRESLSDTRWEHVRGVMEMARRLTEAEPSLPAGPLRRAALFHDNARELPPEEQRRLAEAFRGELDPIEAAASILWHAPAGARRMVERFDMDPASSAVRAVSFHSTGHPDLEPVLKGLLVADYVEPNRSFPSAVALRERVGRDPLDELVRRVLRGKIETCLERSRPVHPRGVEAYNRLCE